LADRWGGTTPALSNEWLSIRTPSDRCPALASPPTPPADLQGRCLWSPCIPERRSPTDARPSPVRVTRRSCAGPEFRLLVFLSPVVLPSQLWTPGALLPALLFACGRRLPDLWRPPFASANAGSAVSAPCGA